MSEPCFRCGARADVACGHREPDPDWRPPPKPEPIKRGPPPGGGGQYNTAKHRKISKGPRK